MSIYLSGKNRIWLIAGAAWITSWAIAFSNEREPLMPTFIVGVVPILLVLAAIWVRRGFKQDKMFKELQTHVLDEQLKASFRKSISKGLSKEQAIEVARPIVDKINSL